MSKIAPDQVQTIKASVDMVDLASRYTDLRRKTARGEYHGPCPKCGGHKRFVVHADGWWFCRDCHAQRGDQIDFVRFLDGCDFVMACQRLGARDLPSAQPITRAAPASPPQAAQWRTAVWQQRAYELVDQAAHRLETPAGAAGRAYLEQRGIDAQTWRVWLLGYTPVSRPWDWNQRRFVGGPAITIPYLSHTDDRILAVRYRRINPHDDRYINEAGSWCVVHGLHLLDLAAHTMIIVEGELNAMSIWQAARDRGVTVLSIGSQSVGKATWTIVARLSALYRRCIAWCDEPATALKVRAVVRSPHVLPIQSPKPDDAKIDANDMLQLGMLPAFIDAKLRALDQRGPTPPREALD